MPRHPRLLPLAQASAVRELSPVLVTDYSTAYDSNATQDFQTTAGSAGRDQIHLQHRLQCSLHFPCYSSLAFRLIMSRAAVTPTTETAWRKRPAQSHFPALFSNDPDHSTPTVKELIILSAVLQVPRLIRKRSHLGYPDSFSCGPYYKLQRPLPDFSQRDRHKASVPA